MSVNHEKGQPKSPSTSPSNLLVSFTNFANGKIPIYWAPKHDTHETYEDPPVSNWKLKGPLQLPNIGKFCFLGGETVDTGDIDTEDYKDPAAPENKFEITAEVLWWGVRPTLKAAFRNSAVVNGLIYPYVQRTDLGQIIYTEGYDIGAGPIWGTLNPAQYDYASTHIADSSAIDGYGYINRYPHYRLAIKKTDWPYDYISVGQMLDIGQIYFELPVMRAITWFRTYIPTGNKQVIGGGYFLSAPGTSGTIPGRCEYTDYDTGLTRSELPPEYVYTELGLEYPCAGP